MHCKFVPICASFLMLLANSPSSRAQPISLETVIKSLKAAEDSLDNLSVECSFTAEVKGTATAPWTDAGSGQLNAVFAAPSDGRFHITYLVERDPWIHGLAPFLTSHEESAFDGRLEQHLSIRRNANGGADLQPTGEISELKPLDFDLFATGWGQTIYGADIGGRPERLSKYFSQLKNNSVKVVIDEKRVRGNEIVVLSVGTGIAGQGHFSMQRWQLNESRNFALVHAEDFMNNALPIVDVDVEAFCSPAKGIYYPTRITRIDRVAGNEGLRFVFSSTKVIVNQANLPRESFNIAWPPHTVITDSTNVKKTQSSSAPAGN